MDHIIEEVVIVSLLEALEVLKKYIYHNDRFLTKITDIFSLNGRDAHWTTDKYPLKIEQLTKLMTNSH